MLRFEPRASVGRRDSDQPKGQGFSCRTSVARRQSSGSQLHPTRLPPPRPAQHERIAHELGPRKQTRPAAIHAHRAAHLEHRSATPPLLEAETPNSATGARTRHRTPTSHVLTRRKLRDQDAETTGSSSNRRSHKGSHRQARTPRQGTKLIRLAPASRVATRDAKRGSTVRPFVGRSPLEGVWRSYALDGRRNTKRAGGEAKTQRHKQADNPPGKTQPPRPRPTARLSSMQSRPRRARPRGSDGTPLTDVCFL